MKIHDVTVTIRPGMVVWPGDHQVELYRNGKIEEGANANVSNLSISVHTGTHVDAPYHFLPTGSTVELLPLDVLVGPVQAVELPDSVLFIDQKVLEAVHIHPETTRILFKTRNSSFWSAADDSFHPDFVGITEDGSQYLVEKGIKLVGIDYLSIAPYKKSRPTHEVMLNAKMVIIEGLDLSQVDPGTYELYCLPLKLMNTDGAPARVILVEN